MTENSLTTIFESNLPFTKRTLINLKESLIKTQCDKLREECLDMPKLRTFVLFKDFYNTPGYIVKPLPFPLRRIMG